MLSINKINHWREEIEMSNVDTRFKAELEIFFDMLANNISAKECYQKALSFPPFVQDMLDEEIWNFLFSYGRPRIAASIVEF